MMKGKDETSKVGERLCGSTLRTAMVTFVSLFCYDYLQATA